MAKTYLDVGNTFPGSKIVAAHVTEIRWFKGKRGSRRQVVVTDGLFTIIKKRFTGEKVNWRIVSCTSYFSGWSNPCVKIHMSNGKKYAIEESSNAKALASFNVLTKRLKEARNEAQRDGNF